jgi:hypothetical protein
MQLAVQLPSARELPTVRADIRTTPRANVCMLVEQLPLCVNLRFYQGDDFALLIFVTNPNGHPVDLTECSARAQIREAPDSQGILASFDVEIHHHLISLHLPHGATSNLLRHTVTPNTGVWDCELTDWNGWIMTLTAGTVTIVPEVTR